MTKAMTSRQRVQATLDHREPDRVPLGIWSTLDGYKRLRSYLGLPIAEQYPVGSTTWSRDVPVEFDVIDKLGLDVIRVCGRCPGGKSLEKTPDGLWIDEWSVKRKLVEHPSGTYLEIVNPPLKDATVDDLADYPWPDPSDPAVWKGLEERVKRLYDETDLAILAQFGRGGIFEQAKYLRGYDTIMYDMAANPEFVIALFDKLTEVEMKFNEIGIGLIGQYINILRLSPEDLATGDSTFVSPKMFERMLRPYYKRSFSLARKLLKEKNPQARLQFHSCGAVYPLLNALIEDGMEIFDPLQPRVAEGSRPARLKQAFGDRIAFWGGIDVQVTLPRGTKEEIAKEVRTRIEEMAPGGGYILSSSHRIQPDIPPENVVAMYEAAKEHGEYPIKA